MPCVARDRTIETRKASDGNCISFRWQITGVEVKTTYIRYEYRTHRTFYGVRRTAAQVKIETLGHEVLASFPLFLRARPFTPLSRIGHTFIAPNLCEGCDFKAQQALTTLLLLLPVVCCILRRLVCLLCCFVLFQGYVL